MKDEGLTEEQVLHTRFLFFSFVLIFKTYWQKHEKRVQHAIKETEFLRLKRSRLGVEDFEPLKVIGRGAFGEGITR